MAALLAPEEDVSPKFSVLILRENAITDEGCMLIVASIVTMPLLKRIDISYNETSATARNRG